MPEQKYVAIPGRLVIVGFGSIGQGVLPLILRHIEIDPARITIITAEPRGRDVAAEYGIRFIQNALTDSNYQAVLTPELGKSDFLLNVSVDVSSVALIEFCQEKGALYLDTCIEPWPGGYTDPSLPPSARSNYGLRESPLALRVRYPQGPTAVLTHGANPGLVSHFVKQALIDLAKGSGVASGKPRSRAARNCLVIGQDLTLPRGQPRFLRTKVSDKRFSRPNRAAATVPAQKYPRYGPLSQQTADLAVQDRLPR